MTYSIHQLPDGTWTKLAAARITISLDFDRTWTAAPDLWEAFTRLAKGNGHSVVIITRRADTQSNRLEIERATWGLGLDAILFTDGGQKRDAAKAAGISVDVWVDDFPEGIPSKS